MQCHEVEELVGPYHDGELDAELRAQVEDHLGTCRRCTALLEEIDSYAAMILRLCGHEVPPPAKLKQSFFRRLRRKVLLALVRLLVLFVAVIIPLPFVPILLQENIPLLGRVLLGLSGLTLTIALAPFFYQALRDVKNIAWYQFTNEEDEK